MVKRYLTLIRTDWNVTLLNYTEQMVLRFFKILRSNGIAMGYHRFSNTLYPLDCIILAESSQDLVDFCQDLVGGY